MDPVDEGRTNLEGYLRTCEGLSLVEGYTFSSIVYFCQSNNHQPRPNLLAQSYPYQLWLVYIASDGPYCDDRKQP